MNKFYLVAGIMAIVLGAFWTGGRIAAEKCRADLARDRAVQITNIQNQINKTKGKINAETNNRAVADIRDWLRAGYTIRD